MAAFLIRVVLFFVGLLFAASLAAAALLLAVWMARFGWARLAGRSATPWSVMFGNRFDPRGGFERFRAAAARQGAPSAADVAGARARGESVRSPIAHLGRSEADVTDVRARPATGHH